MAGYAAVDLDSMDDDSRAREIYAHFGLAIYAASTLEHEVVNALCVINFLPSRQRFRTSTEFERAFDAYFTDRFRETFGVLAKALIATGKLSDGLVGLLREASTRRNYLVHHFFREHAEFPFSVVGQRSMIEFCDASVRLFREVDRATEAELKPYRERVGITDEWLEARMTEDMERVRSEGPSKST